MEIKVLLADPQLCNVLIRNIETLCSEPKLVLNDLNFSTCSQVDNQIALIMERREHDRLNLKIPVLLCWAESKDPMRSETVDISTKGFYCTSKEPFSPGDRLRGLLSIPASADSMENALYLDADIEVIRVLVDNVTPGFGLGCRIAEYHVVDKQTALSWPLQA